MISAVSNRGLMRFMLYEGALNVDRFLAFLRRLVGQREDEAGRFFHLEVLTVPLDPPAPGGGEHRQAPGASRTHLHRDTVERNVRRRSPEPVGEARRLGPLLPDALAGGVEHPRDLDDRISHYGVCGDAYSSRKLTLLFFQFAEDFAVTAADFMRHAPQVDCGEPAKGANMDGRRVGAGDIPPPFAPSAEDGDSGNVDVDAFGHVDVYVAEANERGHGRFRIVDLGLAKI